MAEQKISSRYAASLLEFAIQNNILDKVSSDIESAIHVVKQNPSLKRMLENPVIRSEIKVSVLEQIFRDKISKEALDFLLFVVKKKREDILYSILERFVELRDEKLGFVNVQVKVASEFTDSQKAELQNKLQDLLKKKVRISYEVDEKIIGGFIAKAGDTIFNASIKHQLDLLRKKFTEASLEK